MSIGLRLLIFAPLFAAGGLAAGATTERASSRLPRLVSVVALAAALGGAIDVLIGTLDREVATASGLVVDPLRAALAIVIVAASLSAVIGRPLAHGAATGVLGATGATLVFLFAGDTVAAAAALVVSTAGLGLVALATRSRAAARTFVLVAASDAVVVLALVLGARNGMRTPAAIGGIASLVLAFAAAVRASALPGLRTLDALLAEDRGTAAIVLGVVRAQGFVLAAWAVRGSGRVADALLVGAALWAALCARRAVREASVGAALCAHAALVVAAIAARSIGGGWSASLLLAGASIGAVLAIAGLAGGAGSVLLGATPLGAILPGAAALAGVLSQRGVVQRPVLISFAAVAMAALWLAQAGVAGMRRVGAPPHAREAKAWALVPILACVGIAAIPASALAILGRRGAAGLAGVRGLLVAIPNVSDAAGIVGVGVTLALLALFRPWVDRVPSAAAEEQLVWVDETQVNRTLRNGAVALGVALAFFIVLMGVGIGRGFL